MADRERVNGSQLRVGDRFPSGDEVTAVIHNEFGTWIDTFQCNDGFTDGAYIVLTPRPPV